MRNIIFVVLDTVRKDVFDRRAPRLRERADSWYDGCRAGSSWSAPSHASILTGEYPSDHGVHTYNPDCGDLESTFLDDLQGHTRIGVSANLYAGSAFGFDTYFDEFLDVSTYSYFPEGADAKEFMLDVRSDEVDSPISAFLQQALAHDHPLKTLANGGLAKLSSLLSDLPVPQITDNGGQRVLSHAESLVDESEEPFFLFVNLMDAHAPLEPHRGLNSDLYDAPSQWSSDRVDSFEINVNGKRAEYQTDIARFRAVYEASVDYLDRIVSQFVDNISTTTDRETTTVLTADHGQNLGYESEDNLVYHTGSLSEGVLYVPFEIINPPEATGAHPGTVSHLDVGELLTAFANGENRRLPERRVGAELLGIGGVDWEFDTDETQAYWNRAIRCAYDDKEKIEWDTTGRVRRWTLGDASEQKIAENGCHIPAWAKNLFTDDLQHVNEVVTHSQETHHDIDEASKDRLRELGYL